VFPTAFPHVLHTWRHPDGLRRCAVLTRHRDTLDVAGCVVCTRALAAGLTVYSESESARLWRGDFGGSVATAPGTGGRPGGLVLDAGEALYHREEIDVAG